MNPVGALTTVGGTGRVGAAPGTTWVGWSVSCGASLTVRAAGRSCRRRELGRDVAHRHLGRRSVAGGQAGGERPRHRRRRGGRAGGGGGTGELPGGRAEEARAGAGLAEALHAVGHVLEAGIDVEHLLVDEVGLVALPAVLVVEAEVDVDVLHVVRQGQLGERRERHVEHALFLEAQAEQLLVLDLLGGDVARLLLARGQPQHGQERDRREEREAGVDDLEPDALLHEQERRHAQQDQREQGDADQQQPRREAGHAATRRGTQAARKSPHSSSHAQTGAPTKSKRKALSRNVA